MQDGAMKILWVSLQLPPLRAFDTSGLSEREYKNGGSVKHKMLRMDIRVW